MQCPTCGEYLISAEQIEAPCQLCGRDTCCWCMHECPKCGREVCSGDWIEYAGICGRCWLHKGTSDGYNKVREWKKDTTGIVGIGQLLLGAAFSLKMESEWNNARRENAKAREKELKLFAEAEERERIAFEKKQEEIENDVALQRAIAHVKKNPYYWNGREWVLKED